MVEGFNYADVASFGLKCT